MLKLCNQINLRIFNFISITTSYTEIYTLISDALMKKI